MSNWINKIKIIKALKIFFFNNPNNETQKVIITQRSCPHCINRGMFTFGNNSHIKNNKENPIEEKQ